MPVCFQCDMVFSGIKPLFLHFKIVHNLFTTSTYRCKEVSCHRVFPSTNSFRKHLKTKHCFKESVELEKHIPSLDDNKLITTSEEISSGTVEKKCHDADALLKKSTLTFIAKLYNHSAIPRNAVQLIIDEFNEFINEALLPSLEQSLTDRYQRQKFAVQDITNITAHHTSPFSKFNLNSEYLRLKALSETNCLLHPIEYTLNQRFATVRRNNIHSLLPVEAKAHYIPLRHLLKEFFAVKGYYEAVTCYVNSLDDSDDVKTNFLQCKLWKQKSKLLKKDTLPLFLYCDDYETCNPLGSKAGKHKLGGVYVSFPFLPPQCRSKLENIFIIGLHHAEHRKTFGNTSIFGVICEEFKFLEENGIFVETSLGIKKIYFSLGLIIGDNLGLHGMLGFCESFSCNYPCRFCKIDKNMLKFCFCEDKNLLRTRDMYENDVLMDNVSQTGIKETCLWNTIESFHVTENYLVDIMHDMTEGVCHYDFMNILKYLVTKMKFFSIETLNCRIKHFSYGNLEEKNKPPPIDNDFYKKNKFSMSSSQMLCFTRYFGLLIGDLVPKDNEGWQLFLVLREIINIIYADFVTEGLCNLLQILIKEHHELYTSAIFEDNVLKYKHHNMIHYSSIMSQVGPLKHISAIRYESKHKESKITANSTTSRKNITYTLALKHQMRVCYRFLSKQDLTSKILCGPGENHLITDLLNYEHFQSLLPVTFCRECYVPKWICFDNVTLKRRDVILVEIKELEPNFGILQHILQDEGGHICLVYEVLQTINFNSHFFAYRVHKSQQHSIIKVENLMRPYQHLLHLMPDGCYYVSLRYEI